VRFLPIVEKGLVFLTKAVLVVGTIVIIFIALGKILFLVRGGD